MPVSKVVGQRDLRHLHRKIHAPPSQLGPVAILIAVSVVLMSVLIYVPSHGIPPPSHHPSSLPADSPVNSRTATHARPATWPSFDAGNVTMVFGGSFPSFTLYQSADPSTRVTITLEHIMEVTSGTMPGSIGRAGPLGLLATAFASPSGTAGFRVTLSGTLNSTIGLWVNMSSNITVDALSLPGLAGLPVWESADGEIPVNAIGSTLGMVGVSLNFHLSSWHTPGGQGLVTVSLTIANWPWTKPSATLALEWQYFTPGGNMTQDVACAGTPTNLTGVTAPCSGPIGLGSGQPAWSNGTTAVESLRAGGLLSYVHWVNFGQAQTSQGSKSVSLDTALFPVSGSDLVRVLQVVENGLGAISQFSEYPEVGLFPPLELPLPFTPMVEGDLTTFSMAIAVTVGIVLGVRALATRRDRQLLRRF